MEDTIDVFIEIQEEKFDRLAGRLVEFEPNQHENEASKKIYKAWFKAHEMGKKALERFDAIFQNIQAGQIAEAAKALNVPLQALPQGMEKTFLYMILSNEEAPFQTFMKKIQVTNRHLLNDLLAVAREQGSDPDVRAEIELIATWIVSFPHPEEAPDAAPEKPFFSSFSETVLKLVAGYAAGRVHSNQIAATAEE